jgi:hypothetical protein
MLLEGGRCRKQYNWHAATQHTCDCTVHIIQQTKSQATLPLHVEPALPLILLLPLLVNTHDSAPARTEASTV